MKKLLIYVYYYGPDATSTGQILRELRSITKKKYGLDGKFVIMYSGNIGLYYDLEKLIEVIERFKPVTKTADGREVEFAFVGAGSVLDKLVLFTGVRTQKRLKARRAHQMSTQQINTLM